MNNIGNAGESGLNISCKQRQDKLIWNWSENGKCISHLTIILQFHIKDEKEGAQLNYIEYWTWKNMLIIFERLLQWCNTQPRAARVLTRRSCLGGWDKSNEADNIMIEMIHRYRNILSGLGLVVRATVKTETGACNLEATHTGPLPSSTGQAATVDRLSLLIQVNHHNQIQKLDYTSSHGSELCRFMVHSVVGDCPENSWLGRGNDWCRLDRTELGYGLGSWSSQPIWGSFNIEGFSTNYGEIYTTV